MTEEKYEWKDIPNKDIKSLTLHYDGREWNLIDPNDQSIRDTLDARSLWQRILQIRFRTGEPYINFIDEANKHLPQ